MRNHQHQPSQQHETMTMLVREDHSLDRSIDHENHAMPPSSEEGSLIATIRQR